MACISVCRVKCGIPSGKMNFLRGRVSGSLLSAVGSEECQRISGGGGGGAPMYRSLVQFLKGPELEETKRYLTAVRIIIIIKTCYNL